MVGAIARYARLGPNNNVKKQILRVVEYDPFMKYYYYGPLLDGFPLYSETPQIFLGKRYEQSKIIHFLGQAKHSILEFVTVMWLILHLFYFETG